MDVKGFAAELLRALADTGLFGRVALQTEGPTADGHAYVQEGLFLRFYFNEVTNTIAFALIEEQRRIWGIDCDYRRGWHLHPVTDPAIHIPIVPKSVREIVMDLEAVLLQRTRPTDGE
jgi:hypothetical protein